MPKEIERKFLVKGDAWRSEARDQLSVRQGFLSTEKERTVRVRATGEKAYLTIKGTTVGATRLEYEYSIPVAEAHEILNELCQKPLIEKTRYLVDRNGFTWEVDEFHGDNQGLIVAELELASEDESFDKPSWLGKEVTGDPKYYNANLVAHPYKRWSGVDSQKK